MGSGTYLSSVAQVTLWNRQLEEVRNGQTARQNTLESSIQNLPPTYFRNISLKTRNDRWYPRRERRERPDHSSSVGSSAPEIPRSERCFVVWNPDLGMLPQVFAYIVRSAL